MGFFSKVASFFGGGAAKGAAEMGGKILQGIDGLHTSAEEKAQLRSHVVTGMVEAQASVIRAEMEHGTWLSRSWRPLVMLSFAAILIAHYAVFPLIVLFGWAPAALLTTMTIPAEMWTLLQVGLGGYVGGRSAEKITKMVMPNMKMAKMKKKLLKKLSPEEIKELLGEE